jgi:hypothetical protein
MQTLHGALSATHTSSDLNRHPTPDQQRPNTHPPTHPPAHTPRRYLPQGTGAKGIHRFRWQVQYLISHGFYVILDFHPTNTAAVDPNLKDPALFAANWGALYQAFKDDGLFAERVQGRIIADLVNEARWVL